MAKNYDVVVIGAGTAGLSAVKEIRKKTENFLLINDGPYGTTCARVGCMPSKVMIEAANAYYNRVKFKEFGIEGFENLRLSRPKVFERVRQLRDGFVSGVLKSTDSMGEKSVAGRAHIRGPNQIECGGETILAKKIIIATGSRPIIPASWSEFNDRVLTSDQLFEQNDLNGKIAVIGLGAIGIEVAQALSRMGLEVFGFGAHKSIAGLSDPEVNEAFQGLLEKEFSLHLDERAELKKGPSGINVIYGGNKKVEVDYVVAAMGRRPNIDNMGLENLGVKLNEKGLPRVDPQTLQIEDLPVYLAGDANTHLALLHEAADEGRIAGINAVSEKPQCFERRTPLAIVFSDPNVAVVGQSYSDLKEGQFESGLVNFENQGRAKAAQKNKGILKVYGSKKDGKLLGAEICAPSGEHMAHLLALAIHNSMTVYQLLSMPFYHPVLEEGLRTALRELAKKLPHKNEMDLAFCQEPPAEGIPK